MNLKYQDLKFCGLLDSSFLYSVDQLMENPLFLLRKFVLGGMSKKNETDWTKIIQMTRGTNVAEIILLYFKRYLQNEKMVDFDMPCHIKKDNLKNDSEIIMKEKDGNLSIVSSIDYNHYYSNYEIVKVLEANENVGIWENEFSPIWEKFKELGTITWVANIGHTEIVQVVTSLTDNPNKPDAFVSSTTWSMNKHTETVKILVPLEESLEEIPKILQHIWDDK